MKLSKWRIFNKLILPIVLSSMLISCAMVMNEMDEWAEVPIYDPNGQLEGTEMVKRSDVITEWNNPLPPVTDPSIFEKIYKDKLGIPNLIKCQDCSPVSILGEAELTFNFSYGLRAASPQSQLLLQKLKNSPIPVSPYRTFTRKYYYGIENNKLSKLSYWWPNKFALDKNNDWLFKYGIFKESSEAEDCFKVECDLSVVHYAMLKISRKGQLIARHICGYWIYPPSEDITSKAVDVLTSLFIRDIFTGNIKEAETYIDLGPIKIEHVKTVSEGDYSEIKIKIINTSGRDIDSCELTCVLLKDDKEIDVETNYVVSSTEGGLKNGDFLYFDYIFKTSSSEWNKFDFKIKTIEYR